MASESSSSSDSATSTSEDGITITQAVRDAGIEIGATTATACRPAPKEEDRATSMSPEFKATKLEKTLKVFKILSTLNILCCHVGMCSTNTIVAKTQTLPEWNQLKSTQS